MKIDAERVERFCTTALLALGTMADDAHVVAKHLVDADLRGVRSHGLLRLIKYDEVSAILLSILICVLVVDGIGSALRKHLK